MIASDPLLCVAVGEGRIIRWWADPGRTAEEIRAWSSRDAETFLTLECEIKALPLPSIPPTLEGAQRCAEAARRDRARCVRRSDRGAA